MSEALRIIHSEHGSLWRLLSLLGSLYQSLKKPDHQPEVELFNLIFRYLDSYADRIHHPHEDNHLFPAVLRRCPSAASLIDRLQSEHQRGAELLTQLRHKLLRLQNHDAAAREQFETLLGEYIRLERQHIGTEEEQLIPLAHRHLTAEDWDEIDTAFAEVEDPLVSHSTETEFRELRRLITNLAPEPYGLGGLPTAGVGAAFKAATPAAETAMLLEIRNLDSYYGRIRALSGIDLEVRQGELVALVGANGAGKTTLLRVISGLQPATAGQIRFAGRDITRVRPDSRVAMGICQSPEGRQVFGPLAVEDNLRLGAYTRARDPSVQRDLERIYDLFPILRQKRRQPAGELSGGQQQMLAMGRALMGKPRLLLLDEPSLGLAPLLVDEIFSVIRELKANGITIFLVEQNAHAALKVADRGYVMETGATIMSDTGSALLHDSRVQEAYLGM